MLMTTVAVTMESPRGQKNTTFQSVKSEVSGGYVLPTRDVLGVVLLLACVSDWLLPAQ